MKKAITTAITIMISTWTLHSAGLVERSPFIPQGYGEKQQQVIAPKATAPNKESNFKFMGYSRIGKRYLFNVIDMRSGTALWISPDQSVNGFSILSFESQSKTVEYQWNGVRGSIVLSNSNGTPVSVTQQQVADAISLTSSTSTGGAISQQVIRRASVDTKNNEINSTLIQFDNGYSSNGGSNSTPTPENNRFGVDDNSLPESDNNQDSGATDDQDSPATKLPFKITRNNQVHNPDGKTPDHYRYR